MDWKYISKSVTYNSTSFVKKGAGYPMFMQSKAWQKKSLEMFLSSYAENKHDAILYASQDMSELGDAGEVPLMKDDRGYVEPEPIVFDRLANLISCTREGLNKYGMISESDINQIQTISIPLFRKKKL